MASSSLIACTSPISISSKRNSVESAAKLRLFNSSSLNLSSNQTTPLHSFNRKTNLSLSPPPRPRTVISMASPTRGRKPKKVDLVVKMDLEAGRATPAKRVAPTLGPKGIKPEDFCDDYNARTANKLGYIVPARITVYSDRSYTFVLLAPPTSFLLLRAAGVEKGSKDPKLQKVGKVTIDQLRTIAKEKMSELLFCSTVEKAMRIIAGTAGNMGIDIDPPVLERKKQELV